MVARRLVASLLVSLVWITLSWAQFTDPPVIDTFTQANGTQPPSANWTNVLFVGHGGVGVTNNRLVRVGASGIAGGYWSAAAFGPNVRAAIDGPDLTAVSGEYVDLFVRLQSPNIGGSMAGYSCRFNPVNGLVRLLRWTMGAETDIVAQASVTTISDNDRLGIEANGGTISCHLNEGAGWVPILSGTDATYPYAGYVAVRLTTVSNGFALDNLAAETIAGSPPAPVITVDRNVTHQTMTGWQVHNYAVDEVPRADPSYYNTLIDTAVNDLGVTRIGMPVNSGAENPTDHWTTFKNCMAACSLGDTTCYGTCRTAFRGCRYASVNDNPDPASINAAGFIWTNINDYFAKWTLFRNTVIARGDTPQMSLAYAFVSNQINCGGLGNVHTTPDEYAEFMLAAVQEFDSELGWVPDLIEVKNEPDLNATPWESGQGVLFGQMVAAMGAKLDAAGYTGIKLTLPSPTNAANVVPYYNNIIAQATGNAARIQDISYHCYNNSCINAPPSNGHINMANIQALQISTGKATNMNEWWVGNITWRILHEHVKHANNGSWDIGSLCGESTSPQKLYFCDFNVAPPTIVIDPSVNFYRQYTRYIRPGHVRINAIANSGILDPIAFTHGTMGDRVVTVVNTPGTFTIAGLQAGTYGRRFMSMDGTSVHEDLGDTTITGGQSVSVTTTKTGIVTVWDTATAPPTDTTPPVLSNGSPSGSLAAGTTTASLQVTTDENATCKFDTTPGTAYASMPNTFGSTGGTTSHSHNLTGLTDGSSYSYYVRCQNEALLVNTSDFLISFSILTTLPITYLAVDYEENSTVDWTSGGNGAVNDTRGTTTIITSSPTPHGGTYAARHQTVAPSPCVPTTTPGLNSCSANAIRWNFADGPGNLLPITNSMVEGYYSAWFYFPTTNGGFTTTHWHNLMQWKADSNNWNPPIFFLQPVTRSGVFQIEIWHWACKNGGIHPDVTCVDIPGYGNNPGWYTQQPPIPVPRDQWVHLETYYKAAKTNGHITVWQDGVQIFDLTAPTLNTLDGNNQGFDNVTYNCDDPPTDQQFTCYRGHMWGLGVYHDAMTNETHTLYTDDIIVSSAPVHTPADTTPPAAPTGVQVTAFDSTSVTLGWVPPADADLTGYRITYCSGTACTPATDFPTDPGLVTTYQVTGLTPSTLYRFKIRAKDEVPNFSADSSIVEQTTADATSSYDLTAWRWHTPGITTIVPLKTQDQPYTIRTNGSIRLRAQFVKTSPGSGGETFPLQCSVNGQAYATLTASCAAGACMRTVGGPTPNSAAGRVLPEPLGTTYAEGYFVENTTWPTVTMAQNEIAELEYAVGVGNLGAGASVCCRPVQSGGTLLNEPTVGAACLAVTDGFASLW